MPIEYQELNMVIAALIQKVDALSLENAEFKNRFTKYETPKNCNNCSIPPSKDENRPQRRSLRELTGCKPGGQKEREGNMFKMAEVPDTVERHMFGFCNCCGANVSAISQESVGKRQVIDIPEIKVNITEHLVFKKRCNACSHETKSSFPVKPQAPVSYVNNIVVRRTKRYDNANYEH